MHSTDDLHDSYKGSGQIVSKSIKKYGWDQHQIEILKLFQSRKLLIRGEKDLITPEILTDQSCMNIAIGGSGAAESSEIKVARLSAALTGKKYPNRKLPIKKAPRKKGWKHTEEWRKEQSERLKGKKASKETIEKQKARHANMSEEQRAKRGERISAGLKGKKRGTSWNKGLKMRPDQIHTGFKHSEESKEKNRQAHLGKSHVVTEEMRQNMSAAQKGRPKLKPPWNKGLRKITQSA